MARFNKHRNKWARNLYRQKMSETQQRIARIQVSNMDETKKKRLAEIYSGLEPFMPTYKVASAVSYETGANVYSGSLTDEQFAKYALIGYRNQGDMLFIAKRLIADSYEYFKSLKADGQVFCLKARVLLRIATGSRLSRLSPDELKLLVAKQRHARCRCHYIDSFEKTPDHDYRTSKPHTPARESAPNSLPVSAFDKPQTTDARSTSHQLLLAESYVTD